MNVYITFDRYEKDEWYSVYHVEKNREKAINHCKEVDLVDFISYGPDDCHSFQLVKVVMTRDEYHTFLSLVENPNESKELDSILYDIYHETGRYDVEEIIQTDGCTDCFDVIKYYANSEEFDCDSNDEDERNDIAQERLLADDELFEKNLREYININY